VINEYRFDHFIKFNNAGTSGNFSANFSREIIYSFIETKGRDSYSKMANPLQGTMMVKYINGYLFTL
jgi:hypothetical protein